MKNNVKNACEFYNKWRKENPNEKTINALMVDYANEVNQIDWNEISKNFLVETKSMFKSEIVEWFKTKINNQIK